MIKRRDVLDSPKLQELKRNRRRRLQNKIFFYVGSVLAIFIILVFISRINKLNISVINISGNKIIDTEQIKEIVSRDISGYYLFFIPKSNFLIYPKNKIEKDLAEKYRRLTNIKFNLDGAETLSISLSEREGKYIWCGETLPDINLNPEYNTCSFLDSTGYAFDTSPYFSGNVYFKFFGPLTENNFTPILWSKIISFKEALTEMGLKPASLYIKPDGDIEIYLSSNILPPDSPKVIFKNDFDLEKATENMQAVIHTEPLQADLKSKINSLLYIDLRFGNKVYYKFR